MSLFERLRQLLVLRPEPPPPATAPIEARARLLAAGLVEGHDFRQGLLNNGEERLVAWSPAGERWMGPQPSEVDGRTPSRRFVPSQEQAYRSPLLAGLYQMGASEQQVIEHLHRENEELLRRLMRLSELAPFKAS